MGPVRTWANLMTACRTSVAVVFGFAALAEQSWTLLAIGYAVYWIGDMADGWLARRLDQMTRLGAVADIVADRACTAVLLTTLVLLRPDAAPAVAIFFLNFMVLDCVLSLAFLRYGLLSPNDFHLVHRTLWRLNWSPPAKAANTTLVVVPVLAGLPLAALTAAGALAALKAWSAAELLRLDAEPTSR